MITHRNLMTALIASTMLAAPLPAALAQVTWKQLPGQEIYVRPYEPFRIVGNV